MPHRDIEAEVEQLGNLREAAPATAAPELRKALKDRVNLVVAKAAQLAAELQFSDLIPDLLRAFDRLFEKPAERDPKCWAKLAISRALRDLGHNDSAPFLRGSRHVQMEPTWGGSVDTAPAFRATCVLALVPCLDLNRLELMRHLVDALADKADLVRVDAVRALEQMAGEECALVLRLKAHLGDEATQVTGQVFDSLLRLESDRGVRFVAGFLDRDPEISEEAALALGSSGLLPAVDALRTALAAARDPEFRAVLLRALSLSRQEAALEYLLDTVRTEPPRDARAALEALALHKDSEEIRRRAREAVEARGGSIGNNFEELFGRK